jgi:hypothetical protein
MEMRKWVLTAACVFVAAGTALGGLGSVAGSFPIPGGYCGGLARANDVLFSCNPPRSMIYRCNYLNGSITGSFPTSGGTLATGLAYQSGGYLWQNQCIEKPCDIYVKNALNGKVYHSFDWQYQYTTGTAPYATGDGGEGTSLIILSNYYLRPRFYYMTTNGSITGERSVSQQLFDVAYDWRNRIIWGGRQSSYVYGYGTGGGFVTSFRAPVANVYGITYHGQYLWVAGNRGYIYRIHCPGNLGVRPTSMGKIKAMFD